MYCNAEYIQNMAAAESYMDSGKSWSYTYNTGTHQQLGLPA